MVRYLLETFALTLPALWLVLVLVLTRVFFLMIRIVPCDSRMIGDSR
jgi:hypothetical protein